MKLNVYAIYEISTDEPIYVGSTTHTIWDRYNKGGSSHRHRSKRDSAPLYEYIRSKGGYTKFEPRLLEYVEIVDKNVDYELYKHQRYEAEMTWMDKLSETYELKNMFVHGHLDNQSNKWKEAHKRRIEMMCNEYHVDNQTIIGCKPLMRYFQGLGISVPTEKVFWNMLSGNASRDVYTTYSDLAEKLKEVKTIHYQKR